MIRSPLVVVLLLLAAALVAGFSASPGYVSSPDPFTLQELSTSITGYSFTPGKTVVAPTPVINPSTDLVLIVAGEGNSGTMNFDKVSSSHPTHSLNVNPYDGATYQGVDPWLGATAFCNNGTGPAGCATGGWISYLCDTILGDGNATNVYVVPLSVYTSKAADWATGVLSNRIVVAIRRLAARQPAVTPLKVYVIWGQGESDNGATSTGNYETQMQAVLARALAALPSGWTLVFVVAKETWNNGATDSNIQTAQLALPGLDTHFKAGPNADARGTKYRLSGSDDPTNTYWCGSSCPINDPTKFNGALVYAQDWVAALRPLDPLF